MGNPGRYDEVAERALELTGAECVALLVFRGKKGDGFSVAGNGRAAVEITCTGELGARLRALADAVDGHPPDGVRITTVKS